MFAFPEARWFVCWMLVVIGVLRWFHNASELDDQIGAEEWKNPGQLVLQTGALQNQPNSRAS